MNWMEAALLILGIGAFVASFIIPEKKSKDTEKAQEIDTELIKKLIEEAGRLNVPGRPILYKTTPDFLRTFGISSLEELPPIEKVSFGEPIPEEPEQQSIPMEEV